MGRLLRAILDDLLQHTQRFCHCCLGCCSFSWFTSIIIAIIVPVIFIIQMTGFFLDYWAYIDNEAFIVAGNDTFGCFSEDNADDRLCGVGITAVSFDAVILLFGLCVCLRAIGRMFDQESCQFCYVCVVPVLNIIPGILSFICCGITSEFVRYNGYTCGPTFYMFLATGCLMTLTSMLSTCGYVCLRYFGIRYDYHQLQIGSDDADRETAPFARHNMT